MLALVGCRKNGCMDPLAQNYSPGATDDDGSCVYYEALIENFNGTTDAGGTFQYQYNLDENFFRWTNELTGETEEGNYFDLGGEYSGVLELNIDNETVHTFKSPQGFTVGYFPNEESTSSLAFGTSDEIDIEENASNYKGDYVYFFLSPGGINDNPLYKEWGLISVGPSDWRLVNFATGGEGDYLAVAPYMMDSINFTLPVNDSWDSTPEPWRYDPDHKERILLDSEMGMELTVFASTGPDHSIMAVDVQGEGMGLAMKIDDYSFSDIIGEYRIIDVDRTGFASFGSLEFSGDGLMSYSYRNPNGEDETGSFGGIKKVESVVTNCFYTEGFDDGTEDMYLFFSGGAILYVVLEEGEFISYGMGYRLGARGQELGARI